MVETHEADRIQTTNYERQLLASSQGWGFATNAPELLERWPVKPFTEIGDKRLAYGVVSGVVNGMSFTAFDYHRRPKVTNVKSFGRTVNTVDTILIDTVWVLTLPATLPKFQIFDSAEPNFDRTGAVAPQTADVKVNRGYRLVDTDLGVANQVLTPQVAEVMKQYKLRNWATWGDQLLCVKHPIFGRVKPEELTAKVGELGQLISVLPPHLWGAGGNAAAQPAQQPAPPAPPQQPYAQQPYPQQGYPAQPPHGYPPQPQPGYPPQQPYPQQDYPAQPPHGYPPQPQPGYPPQQPYPQQPYPQQGYPPPPYGYPPQQPGYPGYPPPGYR